MKKKYITFFWRIPLGLLIAFEFFVLLGVLSFKPDFTALGLFMTSVAILIMVELTQHFLSKRNKSISAAWIVLLAVFGVYLDAAGDFLHFYSRFPNYDALLHFVCSTGAAVFVWHVLQKVMGTKYSVRFLLFFTICFITTLGVLYEILEYAEDFFTQSHRLGDGFDTANDLLLDFLGASVIIILWFLKKRFNKK